MDRPGLPKTISSVFVFVLLFIAVSNALGGGVIGILAALLVAVVVTVGYFLIYGWVLRLPLLQRWFGTWRRIAAGSTSSTPDTPQEPEVLGGLSSTGAPARGEKKNESPIRQPASTVSSRDLMRPPTLRKRTQPRKETRPADSVSSLTDRSYNVCEPGPYDVEPGRFTRIPLTVEPGFTVVGTLEEVDGNDFEWMILDENNWVELLQEDECYVEDSGEGEGIYKVGWDVPLGGPWFLVLKAYGKKLIREVEVNLRLSNAS